MIELTLENLRNSYFYGKQAKGLGCFASLLIALKLNQRPFMFGLSLKHNGYYGSDCLPELLKRLKELKREE